MNLIKSILVFGCAFMLFSCQQEIENLTINQNKSEIIERANNTFAAMQMRQYNDQGFSMHYDLHTDGDAKQQKLQLMVDMTVKLNQARFNIPFETLHNMTQNYIDQIGIDPLQHQLNYSIPLQFAAYETAHRAGLQVSESEERDAILKYYLDLLLAQKGVDCDALAELALAIKPNISVAEFGSYRNSILEISYLELEKSTKQLEIFRSNFDVEKDNDNYQIKSEISKFAAKFLGAKKALQLLEGETTD